MYKLLSFDVYGTLINTPPINVKAFRLILEQAGASNIDALTFYQFWESRNIVHYREPYRSYREIGELSLEEAFENFGVGGGTADLIERYSELFAEMQLYPDVLPTLERLADRYRLVVVSNIDDGLLGALAASHGRQDVPGRGHVDGVGDFQSRVPFAAGPMNDEAAIGLHRAAAQYLAFDQGAFLDLDLELFENFTHAHG